MKRPVKNVLGLAVLTYLTQQPQHAYELYRQLVANDAAKTFKLSYGALYSVVKQLLAAGFIRPAGTGRTGNLPQHTVYELTDAGRDETRRWLRDLIIEPRPEYPALAAALSLLIVLPPQEVVEALSERRAKLEAEITAIGELASTTIAGGVHPIFLIEDDYRLALLRAESDFVDALIAKIATSDWATYWAAQPDWLEHDNTRE